VVKGYRDLLQGNGRKRNNVTCNFLNIIYRKSAIYDDLLTVTTHIRKRPLVKIEFDYEIHNEAHELLIEANTVLAFMDTTTNRPMKCPDYILDKLNV